MQLDGFFAFLFIFMLFATPILILVLIVSNISKVFHRQKKLYDNVIIAEYEAPENLSPAEIGYLYDSKVGKKELIATLLHMEQRGLISLDNSGGKGVTATRTNYFDNKPVKKHEQYVLSSLMNSVNINWFSLTNLSAFKAAVHDSLHSQGLINGRQETIKAHFKRYLITYLLINIWVLLIVVPGTEGNPFLISFIMVILLAVFFPFFAGLALFGTIIYNKIVGYPGLIPKKLKRLWPAVEGFKIYVEKVELDRLQFESEDLKQKSKNHALPYAVALNFNTSWQERFK